MTDLLVQTISEETAGLVVYVKGPDEYQNIKNTLTDFQEKINGYSEKHVEIGF